jgi:hypothetical protein
LPALSYRKRLGTIAFAPKEDFCALQAVDIFTYENNGDARDWCIKRGKIGPHRWQIQRLRDGRPAKAMDGIIWGRKLLEDVALLKEEERRRSGP